jgi:hypothetical protein
MKNNIPKNHNKYETINMIISKCFTIEKELKSEKDEMIKTVLVKNKENWFNLLNVSNLKQK